MLGYDNWRSCYLPILPTTARFPHPPKTGRQTLANLLQRLGGLLSRYPVPPVYFVVEADQEQTLAVFEEFRAEATAVAVADHPDSAREWIEGVPNETGVPMVVSDPAFLLVQRDLLREVHEAEEADTVIAITRGGIYHIPISDYVRSLDELVVRGGR